MNYPDPLDPEVKKKDLELEEYSRAGNSYLFREEDLTILKSGKRYRIDFSETGRETVIETDTDRNSDLDNYVLDAEYYRLLEEGISLSHFSTFSDRKKAYVLTGPPNTGKTGINLALNQKGYRFMADEDAPVTKAGKALPLRMPLSIGNNNIEDFQDLLDDLEADYSRGKAKAFKQVRKLPIPLIDKALDRFVEPVKINPGRLNFEEKEKEIEKAFYIQPEKRENIVIQEMETSEFCRKMAIWNKMQRSGFEETYNIWKTEFDEVNEEIESPEKKDRKLLKKTFENVEVKKLKVPLERQPRKIAAFIEGEL